MISPVLIDLLRCPETQQRVTMAAAGVVERIETARAAGGVRNRGGMAVASLSEGCLVRADGAICFPILNGIPLMLVEESIALPWPKLPEN